MGCWAISVISYLVNLQKIKTGVLWHSGILAFDFGNHKQVVCAFREYLFAGLAPNRAQKPHKWQNGSKHTNYKTQNGRLMKLECAKLRLYGKSNVNGALTHPIPLSKMARFFSCSLVKLLLPPEYRNIHLLCVWVAVSEWFNWFLSFLFLHNALEATLIARRRPEQVAFDVCCKIGVLSVYFWWWNNRLK